MIRRPPRSTLFLHDALPIWSRHIFLSIHRITFEDLSALTLDVLHRGFQQLDCDPLPAKFLCDEETGHRPNGLVIHRLEGARIGQFLVGAARLDGYPSHNISVQVSEQTGDNTRIYNG